MIEFNKQPFIGGGIGNISASLTNDVLQGGGHFSKLVNEHLSQIGFKNSLLTHSCTGALELSALLNNFNPEDEVILPSYTFVSTANAFLLRGCKIVLVDVNIEQLCIDPEQIRNAISSKTKAIVVVHYGGVSCDMEKIKNICLEFDLVLIEDAAQCIGAYHHNDPLGTIGNFGTLSFHHTKNVSCGEGGALIVNDETYLNRARILHEKGTNRHDFINGKVDKYSWQDLGSSFILSDLQASLLLSQLLKLEKITSLRLEAWHAYNEFFTDVSSYNERFYIQIIPNYAKHNAHLFYLMFKNQKDNLKFVEHMHKNKITVCSHYVGLHQSPFGKNVAKTCGDMTVTNMASSNLSRLPIWPSINFEMVIDSAKSFFSQ